jgi:hypothetical protein
MPGLLKTAVSLGICATLGLAAQAQAQAQALTPAPAEYPLEAVLTAARQLCSAAPTARAAAEARLPAGWKVVTPKEGSWLGTYLEENRRLPSNFTKEARALAAKVAGRSLEAVVLTTSAPPLPRQSTSCEVIDRTALLSPDDARIGRWAGRPPAIGRRDRWPGLFGWSWRPGLEPASTDTVVNYVTESAARAAGLRSGLTYIAITLPRQASK